MVLASGNYITSDIMDTYHVALESLVKDLSRPVIFHYSPTVSGCLNCFYDSINHRSSNRYDASNPFLLGTTYHIAFVDGQTCPVCKGVGKITTAQSGVYNCVVRWRNKPYEFAGINNGTDGLTGNIPNADVYIKTFVERMSNIEKCVGATIDGVYCIPTMKPTSRGLCTPFLTVAYFKRKD